MNTQIGDIFSIEIDDRHLKYFQLIAYDSTQLNSDVIRAFITKYSKDNLPSLTEIINGEVEFYAHCITKLGCKMNLWIKVGKIIEVGALNNILFRGTSDSGSRAGEQISISNNWYIWKIGDANFTRVGKLMGNNRDAEIGVVVNPKDIVNRMKTGKYNFFYPRFE